MPDSLPAGRRMVMPTTRGEIRWINTPWGIELQETVYSRTDVFTNEPIAPLARPEQHTVKIPWKVLARIIEESDPGVQLPA